VVNLKFSITPENKLYFPWRKFFIGVAVALAVYYLSPAKFQNFLISIWNYATMEWLK